MLDCYKEKAEALGLTVLHSPTLEKLLNQLAKLEGEAGITRDLELDIGDCTVTYGRDADMFDKVLDLLALCVKYPGRKTWVISDYESYGNTMTAIYAVDTVRAATARARASLDKGTKLLRTLRDAARTGARR